MARIHLRPAARADLVEIGLYGMERWGAAAGQDYARSFDDSWSLLSRHPQTGRARDDVSPGLRSWRHRSHIIYYRLSGNRVVVSRILHSAADARKALEVE